MIIFTKCKIEKCNKKATHRGFCTMHYSRFLRHGDPTVTPVRGENRGKGAPCRIDNCDRTTVAFGLCATHYSKFRKYGDPLAGRTNGGGDCSIEGCGNPVLGLKMCRKHYERFKKHGDPHIVRASDVKQKDWRLNAHGYYTRYDANSAHRSDNNTVLQHRQVMGEHIGRPLRKDENVHHKNGDRADNRLENLELWTKSQPAGQRVSDKVKWAKEILAEYGDLDV